MRLKLKEDPREWQKFTAATAVLLTLVAFSLWKRQIISPAVFGLVGFALAGAILLCLIRPRWYRPFYRAGMTVFGVIGQGMSLVLLVVVFLCVLTPLGLLARLLGKNLLLVKRNPGATTYWQPAKMDEHFDREF
jgi:hypothetical protein